MLKIPSLLVCNQRSKNSSQNLHFNSSSQKNGLEKFASEIQETLTLSLDFQLLAVWLALLQRFVIWSYDSLAYFKLIFNFGKYAGKQTTQMLSGTSVQNSNYMGSNFKQYFVRVRLPRRSQLWCFQLFVFIILISCNLCNNHWPMFHLYSKQKTAHEISSVSWFEVGIVKN